MAASFTVTLTELERHMAVVAVNNMKDDEENATRRQALLRLHAKLTAPPKGVR
jgi:hypothetical protein